MATAPAPTTARRNYRLSALIAARAASEAVKVKPRGLTAIYGVLVAHQVAQAQTSQTAVAQMLAEQDIEAAADALLVSTAFTTQEETFQQMLDSIDLDAELERLVASAVQDAGRAAESIAVTVRPNIYHVRYVSPPCCGRCAVLAGRVYRWSTGFQRHPGCDCSMIPTTVAAPYAQDPEQLVRDGLVRGLSKDELRAVSDGADLGRVVNVQSKKAGLLDAGHVLTRAGRPTPAAIYRAANDDRDDAIRRLLAAGYIR